jgi:hypothetical protein
MEIVKNVLEISIKLEEHYREFWEKIYYNDAYIFFKNAILFYKNIQNHKYHNFYNSIINIRLYTGKCIVINNNSLKTFSNKTNISSDEICNLTLQVINILDSVFNNCPRLPFETIVFRRINLHIDDLFLQLKEGDYYRELGINSTSINPFYMWINDWGIKPWHNPKLQIQVKLTIILPKDTKCYYMNIPFKYNNMNGYYNEFEIVLPRDCVYRVKSKKIYENKYFYTLELIHQVSPNDRPINKIEEILPSKLPTKNEIKDWDIKNNKNKCKLPECNWLINIAKQSFEKWNKLPEIEKFEKDKDIFITIKPKKIWVYQSIRNKNFKKILKNEKIITIKNDNITTNKDFLNLQEMLLNGPYEYNTINKNNNYVNKFYEISKKTPLLFLIEVDNVKEMNVKRNFNYNYEIDKIKLKIKSIDYINIVNDYNYGFVKADML